MSPPALLLPGIEGDRRALEPLADLLRGRDVWARDLDGAAPVSIDDLADAVLRGLPDGPVHLFGASLGGLVARRVAWREPHRVCSLVTLGTLPHPRHRPRGLARSATLVRRLPSGLVSRRYRSRIRGRLVEEGVAPELQARLLPALPPPSVLAARLAAVAAWTPLGPPPVPTLWLRGQSDWEAPWEGRDVVRAMPGVQTETVPGGHRAYLTHAGALAAVVGHFFSAHDLSAHDLSARDRLD